MQKRNDSLRSLGLTVVAVDKPLRSDIKAMAAKNGMTMVDYLRRLVWEDKKADPQRIMTSFGAMTTPAAKDSVSRREFEDFQSDVNRCLSFMLWFPAMPLFKFNGEEILSTMERSAKDLDTLESEAVKAVKSKIGQLRQAKLPNKVNLPAESDFGAAARVSAES